MHRNNRRKKNSHSKPNEIFNLKRINLWFLLPFSRFLSSASTGTEFTLSKLFLCVQHFSIHTNLASRYSHKNCWNQKQQQQKCWEKILWNSLKQSFFPFAISLSVCVCLRVCISFFACWIIDELFSSTNHICLEIAQAKLNTEQIVFSLMWNVDIIVMNVCYYSLRPNPNRNNDVNCVHSNARKTWENRYNLPEIQLVQFVSYKNPGVIWMNSHMISININVISHLINRQFALKLRTEFRFGCILSYHTISVVYNDNSAWLIERSVMKFIMRISKMLEMAIGNSSVEVFESVFEMISHRIASHEINNLYEVLAASWVDSKTEDT